MNDRSAPKRIAFLILVIAAVTGCATVELPKECVPMSTTMMPDGHHRVLLVVAHQDDDVFIVSRLRDHLVRHDDLYVVWTAISTPFGENYAKERIAESEKAMTFLGVGKDRYYYLNAPDGQTYKEMAVIIAEVKSLIRKIQPDLIYIPAFEIGHIDHDVAHYSVVRALGELGYQAKLLEFPLYNAYETMRLLPFKMRKLSPTIPTQCRVLTKEENEYVARYWDIYKSQQFPLGWFISVTPGKRTTFGIEYLRVTPQYDYLKMPLDAQPAYERFLNNVTFKNYFDAVLDNKNKEH